MVVIFSTSLLVMLFFFLLCFVLLSFALFSCFWVFERNGRWENEGFGD